MDQWTSKSVNLISGKGIVNFTYAGHVSDENDASTYTEICEFVEHLAQQSAEDAEETEIRLFSHGGKKKGAWRSLVKENC